MTTILATAKPIYRNKQRFLQALGLDHNGQGRVDRAIIAEGAIDPETQGSVCVKIDGDISKGSGEKKIEGSYWYRLPNGQAADFQLFELDYKEMANGSIVIDSIKIGGFPLDISERGRSNLCLTALKTIISDMRQGQLPQVAKAFYDCNVFEQLGEDFRIPGQSRKGGFNFNVRIDSRDILSSKAGQSGRQVLPKDPRLIEAFFGLPVNTLDLDQIYENNVRGDIATNRHSRREFYTETGFRNTLHNPNGQFALQASLQPEETADYIDEDMVKEEKARAAATNENVPQDALAFDNLSKVFARRANGHPQILDIALLDEPIDTQDYVTLLRAIGVINRMQHDLRRRQYPKMMDHLTAYRLADKISYLDMPPPLSQGGRSLMISVFGNGVEEIAEGFGNELGSCKVLIHEGIDNEGRRNAVAVMHDLPLAPAPNGSEWSCAIADAENWLDMVDHIFITHKHIDHSGAIAILAQKGKMKHKTVHATPETIRNIIAQLERSSDKIDRTQWPEFKELKNEGWHHIEDKHGKRRISVNYCPDATPHSARCTPMRYIFRYGSKILGSYLNPGDMRFGKYNDEGQKPYDGNWLNKAFFAQGLRGLAKEDKTVRKKDVDRQDTLADYDLTSVRRKGWAPTEQEVEDNVVWLYEQFPDMSFTHGMLSSNDQMREIMWRVAVRLGRDCTEVGANLENEARAMNILGVNTKRIPALAKQNIQGYLDWYYEQQLSKAAQSYLKNVLKAYEDRKNAVNEAKDLGERPPSEITLDANFPIPEPETAEEFLAYCHALLRQIGNPYKRFEERAALRQTLEQDINDRFGDLAYATLPDTLKSLGVLRVGRDTKTAKAIARANPGGQLYLVTGTQGSFVEEEATLPKMAEGRSMFDLNAKDRPATLQIDHSRNIVVNGQPTIPGNEKDRQRLNQALQQNRNRPVIDATHDGFRVMNLDAKRRKALERNLKAMGKDYRYDEQGGITIYDMPVALRGHGFEEDVKAWLKLIKADVNAAQHTDDLEAVRKFIDLATRLGLQTPGRLIEDFEAVDINKDAKKKARVVAKLPSSIVLVKIMRPHKQQYGGHIEGKRVVKDTGTGLRTEGLRAGGSPNDTYEEAFAVEDFEQARRKARPNRRPRPSKLDTRPATRTKRPYQGATPPGRSFG